MGHYLKNELYELVKKDERIFDFIQEGSLDGLWYWDLEKPENEWMNPRFWNILGYNPEEMPHLSSAWQNIIDQDDLKVATDNFNKHTKDPNHPYDQIVRYKHKNGHTVWVRCRGIAIRDEQGKPYRMLGAHQDITALKEAEKKLQSEKDDAAESREKYKAMYENSPVAFQSLNADGLIIDINPQWMKTLGYNREEVLGKWFGGFLHEDFVEHFKKNFPIFKKQGCISDVQFKMKRKTGESIFVSFEGRIGLDNKGAFKQTYCTFKDITKEKEAIEQLSKSEARYKQLIETASDAIYLADEAGIVIDTNRSATIMLQKTKEEIVGNKLESVDPNFSTEAFIEYWENVPIGEQRTFETTHITKNGALIPIEISGKRFIIDNKAYYFGIARDLTERKKALRALTESEEKFRRIFEFANIGIALADEKCRQFDVNNELLQKLGYTKEEFLGFNFIDFSHPEDKEKELPLLKEILEGETDNYRLLKRMKKKDGDYLWFDVSVTALKNEKGNVEMFFAMTMDITEQKKAEEETAILADMLDAAPNSIMIHDEKGSFLYANQKTFELHGYEPEEFMALTLKEIDVPESAERIEERIQSIKENGYGAFEVEHFRKNGSRIPLEIYVKFVSWKGSPAILSIATDISDRKKWIQELVIAKEKAEEANRLKTEFLNNMSHEIRTPMNGIMGFSEMLDQEDITNEKRKYYSRIVQNSSHQLLRIIDDILEISTLETKQDKPVEGVFCLNDLIMELFSIFNLKALERNISIYVKKGLSDSQSNIISDGSKLNKILSNLLENALKFTSEGFIEIGYSLKDNILVLYVKDTGIGISPHNQEIIFERFSQEDKEISRNHGGLGLGLSISKENATLLGGDITLESDKGKGSIFYVTLPYKPAPKINNDSTGAASGSDIETKVNETPTILVAEDEEVNYLYIEALMANNGGKNVKLIHAINGKEAVEKCLNCTIDLVLMDIKMPVMGGLEATEKIKEKFPQLPVIAQTAYSTESDKQLALKHGCDDFISKPINKEKLFAMISHYVNIN